MKNPGKKLNHEAQHSRLRFGFFKGDSRVIGHLESMDILPGHFSGLKFKVDY